MGLGIALICFPVIFLGELPDKTMFASLVLSTKGRLVMVWLGAAAAFSIHVVIAVSIGVALFTILPHRAVDGVVTLRNSVAADPARATRDHAVTFLALVDALLFAITTQREWSVAGQPQMP